MKTLLFPCDDAGCGFYRMIEPARVAPSFGADVEIHETFKVFGTREEDATLMEVDADVAVIQRPVRQRFVQRIEEFQAQGIAVVVELDDDLSRLHPKHVSRDFLTGQRPGFPDVHWKFTAEAARKADLVTVTSDALAERFAPHGRYRVLPNCVPAAMLDMPRLSDGETLGWSGAANFHPDDLQVTRAGVQEALQDTGWHFMKIGGGAERCQLGLGLSRRPEQTGPLPIEGYHRALGALDVGIVPLHDSAFNAAKSYLKGIEYAARGVPFVASEVAEYQKLAGLGVGMLAKDRGRNWRTALRTLMWDKTLRDELAQRGQERVRESFTYECQGWRWTEAWEDAVRVAGAAR